jgi:hypothetical protein
VKLAGSQPGWSCPAEGLESDDSGKESPERSAKKKAKPMKKKKGPVKKTVFRNNFIKESDSTNFNQQ